MSAMHWRSTRPLMAGNILVLSGGDPNTVGRRWIVIVYGVP
jgi:hypothetical protein